MLNDYRNTENGKRNRRIELDAACSRCLVEALDPRAFLFRGLPDVVAHLQLVPQALMRSQRSRQSQRHIGGDARGAVQNTRQRGTGDVELLRRCGHIHVTERVAQNPSGMRWVVHPLHENSRLA